MANKSNFFSDDNLKMLEKFVSLMDKMQKELKEAGVNQDTLNKKTKNQADMLDYINNQLEHGGDINVEKYQRMNELLSDARELSKREYKTLEEKAKLQDKINRKLWERRDILKDIENQNKAQQRLDKIADTKREILYSAIGTNAQNVQDMKDGTYGMKAVARVFKEAVNIFKTAVETGIKANYETTENTLNRIVASNSTGGRFNWNRGNFSLGSNTYRGYKQINNAVVDSLNRDNLYNNISNTSVVEAAAKLTSESGFGLEEAIAKGYQDTVIKYIVPYMDTTSEAFESLEMMMPRNFKKCGSN